MTDPKRDAPPSASSPDKVASPLSRPKTGTGLDASSLRQAPGELARPKTETGLDASSLRQAPSELARPKTETGLDASSLRQAPGGFARPKTETGIDPSSLRQAPGGFARPKTDAGTPIPPASDAPERARPPTDPKLRGASPNDASSGRVRAPTEPHLRAISPLARPKTETGLRIPIPSQDSDSSAVFLLTVHPDHLLIEAVGIFTIQDMRAETTRAAEVIRQPGRRWNIITDFTHCHVSERGVNEILSEYSKGNRPFVRKSAVVGLSGVKSFFFDMVVRLSSRRDLKPFNTIDDAVAWLREPLPGE
jgi:hypothetical protein